MHAIARLVEQVRTKEGWSNAEMVRRAKRAGHPISEARWSQLMLNDIVFFGAKNVEALAAALDVPIERVVAAYLDAMGYPLPQVKIGTERAIRLDERLSVDDRENLLALHRSMVRRQKLRALRGLDGGGSCEDTGSEQNEHDEPRSPTTVVRGVAKPPGEPTDESAAEDNDLPTVARPDGAVADVENSVCEAPGGDGETDPH
jgi:hypothetical protein